MLSISLLGLFSYILFILFNKGKTKLLFHNLHASITIFNTYLRKHVSQQ